MSVTEDKLQAELDAARSEKIAYHFMKKHVKDYDATPRNSDLLRKTLADNHMEFTVENLEACFKALVEKGWDMAPKETSSPAPQATEQELPPVPPAVPDLRTLDDIKKCPKSDYKKAWFGPHQAAFRARIEEVLRRNK